MTAGGVMVTQTGVPFFQPDELAASVGHFRRLFADAGPDVALDLVESRTTPTGVTIQVYRTAGRPRYENATSDLTRDAGVGE